MEHRPRVLAAVLWLAGGCSGEPVELVAETEAYEPADPRRRGIAIPRPPPPGDDWRGWAAEHSAGLRHAAPELHAGLVALAPVTTRSGELRLVDPRLHHPSVAPVLLERMVSERSPGARAALAEALPATGGYFARALTELMADEPESAVRVAMAQALGRGRAPHATEGLAHGLRDEEPEVRRAAVEATALRSDGRELIALLLGAVDDPEASVRHAAVRALGTLRARASLPVLEDRLDDPDPTTRRHALRAVHRVDARRLRDGRLERMTLDPDPRVRRLASRLHDEAAARVSEGRHGL